MELCYFRFNGYCILVCLAIFLARPSSGKIVRQDSPSTSTKMRQKWRKKFGLLNVPRCCNLPPPIIFDPTSSRAPLF